MTATSGQGGASTQASGSGNVLSLSIPASVDGGTGGGTLGLNFNFGGNGTTIANNAYSFLNQSFGNDEAFENNAISGAQSFVGAQVAPLLGVASNLGAQFSSTMPDIVSNLFGAAANSNATSLAISANSTAASEAASQASIQESNNANSGGGCFITTAVCGSLDLPDDCFILTKLRAFRDSFMTEGTERRALVKLYYAVAPTYVERIDKRPDAKAIYFKMYTHFIRSAVDAIDAGEPDEAFALYCALIEYARVKANGP
jgi:hypothetical protein